MSTVLCGSAVRRPYRRG